MSIKKLIALLSLTLAITFSAPYILTSHFSDDTASIFLGLGDEEPETKEVKDLREYLEIEFLEGSSQHVFSKYDSALSLYGYLIKTFKDLHIENISPPPDFA